MPLNTLEMNPATFAEYALSPDLEPDEVYTVEILIERVRSHFDPNYWADWSERGDARQSPDYKPRFSKDDVRPAGEELAGLSWLSFQRLQDQERPIRDLRALRFLTRLTGLVLINNEVSDISPISSCAGLKRIYLEHNPVRDLSPLAGCAGIEELHLGETPVEDFSVLEALPNLRELSISADQIARFRRLGVLPGLRKLIIGGDEFDSFEGFPRMPELRVIRNPCVHSLEGLERFPRLENLVNFFGEFDTLEPLRGLKRMTHANFLRSRVRSLEPIAGLHALRDIRVVTDAPRLELSPLEALPALHKVNVECDGQPCPELGRLRSMISPWDVEFRAPGPRHAPSLELEVVDQETFDRHDGREPFNISGSDSNEQLLGSELEWLDEQIQELLSVDFRENEDYWIPCQWHGARSRTVVLLSDRAVECFPRLVLGIQDILCHAARDWIIYLHSDDTEVEFAVWVYADRVMVAEEYSGAIRNLIHPS